MAVEVLRRRLTADEFVRMGTAGILRDEERLELVQGEIVQMAPIGARHHSRVMWLDRVLHRGVGDRALVSVQGPLELGSQHVLYPDVVLLRPRPDGYARSLPTAADALLVIEVADTTIEYDRGVKVGLYARAGVPEVWINDLTTDQVETYRDPDVGRYRQVQRLRPGEWLAPIAFDELRLSVSELLGR